MSFMCPQRKKGLMDHFEMVQTMYRSGVTDVHFPPLTPRKLGMHLFHQDAMIVFKTVTFKVFSYIIYQTNLSILKTAIR